MVSEVQGNRAWISPLEDSVKCVNPSLGGQHKIDTRLCDYIVGIKKDSREVSMKRELSLSPPLPFKDSLLTWTQPIPWVFASVHPSVTTPQPGDKTSGF